MSSSVNDDVFSDFGQDSWLLSVANVCEKIVRFCSYIFCWAYPLLILAILISVIMRYGFNNGMMVFEEIQWTFYGVGLMFGLSYAEITNSQVRVDVIADKFKPRTRYIIEIVGIILFMTPFLYVVITHWVCLLSGYSKGLFLLVSHYLALLYLHDCYEKSTYSLTAKRTKQWKLMKF